MGDTREERHSCVGTGNWEVYASSSGGKVSRGGHEGKRNEKKRKQQVDPTRLRVRT